MKTISIQVEHESGPKDSRALLEQRINTADRNAWVARLQTGLDLAIILDDELFRPDFESFDEYINTPWVNDGGVTSYRFIFDAKEARRRIQQSISYNLLKKYKEEKNIELPLPDNTFQMRPITALPRGKQAPLYFKAVEHAKRCSVAPTEEFLRQFVSNGEEVAPEPVAAPDEVEDVIFPDEPIQKRYQPDAARALSRIDELSAQSIFPDLASKAVREGFISIHDDDLAMWGRMPDEDFIPVGRMLFRLQNKITFTAARRFQAKCKDPEFLDRIVLYAIKEGSSVIQNHDGFQISIRPIPSK